MFGDSTEIHIFVAFISIVSVEWELFVGSIRERVTVLKEWSEKMLEEQSVKRYIFL